MSVLEVCKKQFYGTLPPSWSKNCFPPPGGKIRIPPPAGPFSTPLLPPTTVPKYDCITNLRKGKSNYFWKNYEKPTAWKDSHIAYCLLKRVSIRNRNPRRFIIHVSTFQGEGVKVPTRNTQPVKVPTISVSVKFPTKRRGPFNFPTP